jgi:hypothetical protein
MNGRRLVAVLLLLTLPACATRIGDLSLATSKNLSRSFDSLAEDVEGKDCARVLWLLFIPIPFGSLQPSLEEAMDRAIEKVPGGDMMTNVTITNEPFLVPLLVINYRSDCLVVEGDVGKLD